jgi:hypothetical protein
LIACSKSFGVPYFGSISRASDVREDFSNALREYPISPLTIEPMIIGDQERELLKGTLELCRRAKVSAWCLMDLERAKFVHRLVDGRSRWKEPLAENIQGQVYTVVAYRL